MITGAHFLLYSKDPEADRLFFRDILEFSSIDAGESWLIFALPPSEIAIHPSDENFVQLHGNRPLLGTVLYLMCNDLGSVIRSLKTKGVSCTPIAGAEWGIKSTIRLPSGGELGLYQPTHPTAISKP
ncbi:MAG TPA: hypothetical protein VFO40_01255 [Chthoniobacterales bacterium]|nr:hypothetical protein [Chthoniobacterales bacterium]